MPAALTTLAHSATSDLMMSAKAPSGALFASQPAVSSFSRTSAVASAASSALSMRSTIGCGRSLRDDDPEPRRHLRLGKALFGERRHIGEVFGTGFVDRADDADGAGLYLSQCLVHREERGRDEARGDIGHHLRIAAIADTGHIDPGGLLEQLEAEMAGRALAGMAVVQRARL